MGRGSSLRASRTASFGAAGKTAGFLFNLDAFKGEYMHTQVQNGKNGSAGHSAGWTVNVLDEHFNQRGFSFDDPKVTGRQIAHEAGFRPADEAIVLQQLKEGSMEEVRLEELVDLTTAGAERFFIMTADRTYRLVVDGLRLEWPREALTGEAIRKLAGRDDQVEVIQELEDAPDRVIEEDEVVSLKGDGTEKFKTRRAVRLITVFYGEQPHEMPRGAYTTEQLREEFKVEDGYVLALIAEDGSFEELKPGHKLRLKDGMKFVSYAPCGQSS
jgi:hypothetical protein